MPFHQQCHAMFRLCLKIPLNVVGINLITLFTFIFSIARFENNAERTRAGISTSSFPADYLAGLGFNFSSGWKHGGFPDLIKNTAFGLGLGVKGRAGVSEIELDGHAQCTLGFKENNFQTQRAAPT